MKKTDESVIEIFTDDEINFMKWIGISADFQNPSDDDWVNIEDSVADILQIYGFDKDYNITPIGKKCEDILDKLPID